MLFSKTLVKLIDEAIVPALIIVAAKAFGVFFVARVFGLPFEIKTKTQILPLPTVSFDSLTDYVIANSYSNLIMFLMVVAGLIWVLVKAHHFHASHISPKLAARLTQLRLSGLISQTLDVYHQALVWLLFLWFTVALLGFYAYLGLAYKSFAIIAFLVAVNLTWFLIFDVEREMVIWQKRQEA